MGGRFAFVVLVICLGTSALIVEARTHKSFSASSYYDSNETMTTIDPKVEPETNTTSGPLDRYPNGYQGGSHVWNKDMEKYETVNETVADPLNRYPNGYTGSKHVWNAATEKYESVGDVTTTDPTDRYAHGYYGKAKFDYKEGDTLTVVKSTGTVEKSNDTDTDPLNRYAHGYYGKAKFDYKEGDTLTVVKSAGTVEKSNDTDTDPLNRYAHGYYGKAKFDYKEGDTLTVVKSLGTVKKSNDTDTDPLNRYEHGYYGKAKFDYKEGDTLTVVKSAGTVEKPNDTDSDPLNRYPNGYAGSKHVWNAATKKYESVSNVVTTDHTDRYAHGYYGKATFDYKEGDTLTVVKSEGKYTEETSSETTPVEGTLNRYPNGYNNGKSSHPSYTSVSQPDTEKFDPLNRYPQGYYGKAAQTTKAAADGERYPNGYFTSSEYGKTEVKPVSYSSYTGNFQTLPYPSTGIPFVPNGAGCRAAYWADHTTYWPAFLPVTSTVGDAFGEKAVVVYGQTTILDALLKYGSDPYSELLRAGCTALLNSYLRGGFAISHIKVIEELNAALVSKEAATAQALKFETENVASISAGDMCT